MTLNLILVLRMVSQSTEVSKSFSKVLQMLDVLRLSLKKKKKLLTFLTDALTLHYIATDRKKKKKKQLKHCSSYSIQVLYNQSKTSTNIPLFQYELMAPKFTNWGCLSSHTHSGILKTRNKAELISLLYIDGQIALWRKMKMYTSNYRNRKRH